MHGYLDGASAPVDKMTFHPGSSKGERAGQNNSGVDQTMER